MEWQMFAVIKTGGKQYKVSKNDVIRVEKLNTSDGDVAFDQVLLIGEGENLTVGAPIVEKAVVFGEIVKQMRSRKVLAFYKKRRKHFRRTRGHRQELTVVRIVDVSADGIKRVEDKKPVVKKAAPKVKEEQKSVVTAPTAAAKEATKKAPEKSQEKSQEKSLEKVVEQKTGFQDDVSLISGVGATLVKKLAGAGVTSLKQIAQWSDSDIEKIDQELNLRGRATREEWVEQAKELLAGKPPRAKIDQEHAEQNKK